MYNKPTTRREFIKNALLNVSLLSFVPALINSSCKTQPKKISGKFIENNSQVGHLLRNGFKGTPTKENSVPIIIIGAGVSGLATAYKLHNNNIHDFLIFDLAAKAGGNSISDSNHITAYPWAAHYLPIVNNTNTELMEFLHKQQIITGFDSDGLPIYNDYYLCFDPEDRLYINGHWQDGLIPNFGVPENEKKEMTRFFKLVDEYKHKIGKDGKPYFEIPVSLSSNDDECRTLDKILFSDFLNTHQFTSPHLLWYLNYCCKDDYGSTINDTSAYAGLHYFCARRAKASNAESSAILTWPEGNRFLVNKLLTPIKEKLKTDVLVTQINCINNKVEITTYNSLSKQCVKYIADKAIVATPQYINNYLFTDTAYKNAFQLLEYTPWMVANISVNDLYQANGEPLSWDNVIYNSPSLGYVNACHQHLEKEKKEWVLTYYLPLTHLPIKEARKMAREKTHEVWVAEIITDLKKAHPHINDHITNIDIKIWGHGMVKPKPNIIFNSNKELLNAFENKNLFFAHSDLSGISIFEEAFYQGTEAANKIIALYDKTTNS